MKRRLSIALLTAALVVVALPGAAQAFGIKAVEGWLHDPAGAPFFQAGAHPDFNTTFHLTSDTVPNPSKPGATMEVVQGNPKDVEVTLPPGMIGNPMALPKCTQGEMVVLRNTANCDPSSQVGVATITNYVGAPTQNPVPIYNMVPPPGVAAEFAFNFLQNIVRIDSTVAFDGEYRVRTTVTNISQGLAIGDTSVTLWGVPASQAHDLERAPQGKNANTGTPVLSTAPLRPLMTNPTACSGAALSTAVRVDSWQAPGLFDAGSYETDVAGNPMAFTGCDQVPFEASLETQPTNPRADSPTGLDVTLQLPQNQAPEGVAAASLREATIVLPEGMAVSPSSAGGLGACAPDQIELGSGVQPSCPASSRIGSVRIDTPLLEEPLAGSVFLAQQRQNKFGSLLALYLVVDDPATGVLLKIPGKVEPDPGTGRLVARFSDAPQLPFERLKVHLDGGQQAPLVTPPTCGTFSTRGEFTPWSGSAAVVASESFKVVQGPEGGPCPTGGFDPTLGAGTANPAAGSYSPFEVRISRPDGSARLSSVSVRLPKGLLAKLAGITYCPDAALGAIPTAEGTGAAQVASPSCAAASRVGSVAVSAGAGQSPFWVKTGSAYLAGPYKGAPLSLAIVTPALAGPFDLGNVVVRVALQVDPVTAQVTAVSDPLPTILSGIPLDLREVRVTLDRDQFMRNPTSCASQQVDSMLTSVGGAGVSRSARFTVAACRDLGFSPRLALSLKGGTRRGTYPQLTAKLSARPGQANLSRVAVALPHSEFLAQEHIKTICTRVQFAAEACPAASVYGFAEARTPLLDQPLRGPVYLRSSSHKLPDLVAALRGQINIDLDGRIDSHNQGIRTTFEGIPDAPISSFILRMRGGKRGLLVNSTSLCGKKAKKARSSMTAQNDAHHNATPPLKSRCGKKKR